MFMSQAVIDYEPHYHSMLDDVESHFWVTLYSIIGFCDIPFRQNSEELHKIFESIFATNYPNKQKYLLEGFKYRHRKLLGPFRAMIDELVSVFKTRAEFFFQLRKAENTIPRKSSDTKIEELYGFDGVSEELKQEVFKLTPEKREEQLSLLHAKERRRWDAEHQATLVSNYRQVFVKARESDELRSITNLGWCKTLGENKAGMAFSISVSETLGSIF
jgi:hypothetical protein